MKPVSDDEVSENSSITDTSTNLTTIFSNVDRAIPGERMLAKSRERNREHARRTRLRKKAQMQDLQLRIKRLEVERNALRQSIEECSIASILLGLSGNVFDDESIAATTEEVGGIASCSVNRRKRLLTFDSSDLIIKVNGVETIVNGNGKGHVNWKTGVYTDEHGAQHYLSSTELEALRRERNRKHAKHTRLRKKAHLDCIQQDISKLEEGNRTMRDILSKHSPTLSAVVCAIPDSILLLSSEQMI